ncbi:retropepsin-like aspartic protease [Proteiniborus sp.]|uniref:retropepsin-like aspartic protease n=1 Tax=Proteiniborus sp. TaxID=2079015 RepID=UPI00332FF8A0
MKKGDANMYPKNMKVKYGTETEIIKMSKTKIANLFVIDVQFEDKIVPLVYDTGASITVISNSVSKLIDAIPTDDSIIGGGNANIRTSLTKNYISSCQIGKALIENILVAVVPDESLDFGVDESGNSLAVSGFLGWDILQHFKWTIDSQNKTFTIRKPANLANQGNLDWDNMPIIKAELDNKQIFFGFDTGNTESMFSHNFIPFLKTKQVKADAITGVDGVVEEEVFVAENIELNIGNEVIRLNNTSVLQRDIFPTKKYQVMGLLAADIIQNCRCIIDYAGRSFEIIKD